METIDEMPDLAVNYISSFLPRLTRSEAAQYYERYVHPYFTHDGHVDFGVATTAVTAIADELGVAAIPAEAIYRFGCWYHPLAGECGMQADPQPETLDELGQALLETEGDLEG